MSKDADSPIHVSVHGNMLINHWIYGVPYFKVQTHFDILHIVYSVYSCIYIYIYIIYYIYYIYSFFGQTSSSVILKIHTEGQVLFLR